MKAGLRPYEFWKLSPVETFDFIEAFCKIERVRNREDWKRTRWLATWIVNMSGKVMKRTFQEKDLLKFEDEVVRIDPKERERQAMETLAYHAKMFPKLIKLNKDGKPRIYGRDN